MKTKNIFWLLMICLSFTLTLTSCGSDDDDDNGGVNPNNNTEVTGKLEGVWEIYNGSMNFMGQKIVIDKNTMMDYVPDNVTIWDETLRFSGNKVNGVDYTVKEGYILIEGMSIYDDVTIHIKKLTDKVLVLDETVKMDGLSVTVDLEYHKK